jgi:hypothetical protein
MVGKNIILSSSLISLPHALKQISLAHVFELDALKQVFEHI